jgi:hypothetical protein
MLPVLTLLLAAVAATADPAVPEISDRAWSVTAWPNAAVMADKRQFDLEYDLNRTLTCIKGQPQIELRTYYYGPRPPGARKGCDAQCRAERIASEAEGRRPSGFSQQSLDWPQAMALLKAEGWAPGQPLRRKPVRPGSLVVEEGEIDENLDGVPDDAASKRKVRDPREALADLTPRFAAACRFKLPRPPSIRPLAADNTESRKVD